MMVPPRENPDRPESPPLLIACAMAFLLFGLAVLTRSYFTEAERNRPAIVQPVDVHDWLSADERIEERCEDTDGVDRGGLPISPTLLGSDWPEHDTPGTADDAAAGASSPAPSSPSSAVRSQAARRSPHWPLARARHIAGSDPDGWPHDCCAVCGSKSDLNVHHVAPFHERPELELDPANLITLCREHHLHVGHDPDLDGPIRANWKTSNPNARRDAARLREKLNPRNRP